MSKPRMVFTEEDFIKIERMAAAGLNMRQIASIWDRDERTFRRYYKEYPELTEALKRGRSKANLEIGNIAYKMAKSGNTPAMTMFWLKCRANWKETSVHEHKGLTLEELVNASREIEDE